MMVSDFSNDDQCLLDLQAMFTQDDDTSDEDETDTDEPDVIVADELQGGKVSEIPSSKQR